MNINAGHGRYIPKKQTEDNCNHREKSCIMLTNFLIRHNYVLVGMWLHFQVTKFRLGNVRDLSKARLNYFRQYLTSEKHMAFVFSKC
jgi:glycosidase